MRCGFRVSDRFSRSLGEAMTDAERKVLDAAREWLTERQPRDDAEKALFAATLRAYPKDAHTRETCDCGEECDECPTAEQVEAMVVACEKPPSSRPAPHFLDHGEMSAGFGRRWNHPWK